MLAAEKTTMLAHTVPTRSIRKGGPTKANSTAVVPLSQENGLGLWKAIMAQPNCIQAVLVIEVTPEAVITLMSPENNGL
jgi:hypothetical protein